MKNFAFTLAEVLITLGIIGVIAAMTIPSLLSSINDVRWRTSFLKTYSSVSQAIKHMESEGIVISPSSYTVADRQYRPFYESLAKNMANVTNCGDSYYNQRLSQGCFDSAKSTYKSFRGNSDLETQRFDDGQLIMPDGSIILVDQPGGPSFYVHIYIDVNGVKPPNRLGYDLFVLQYTDDGLKVMGQPGTDYEETDGTTHKYCDKHGGASSNGMSCASFLLKDSNYYKWLKKVGD